MADAGGQFRSTGAARRRRERRLRSMLRYERMTVRMELAAALHHSAGSGKNDAVRSQKTVGSRGGHPGVLQEPEVPMDLENVLLPSLWVPSLATPSLADAMADEVDSSLLSFLTAQVLEEKRKEQEEEKEAKRRKKQDVEEAARAELRSLLDVPRELRTAEHERRITAASRFLLASSSSRRKRKSRKKKVPKASPLRALRLWQSSSVSGCCLRSSRRKRPPSSTTAVVSLGWYCWFRCFSRCVPFVCGQAFSGACVVSSAILGSSVVTLFASYACVFSAILGWTVVTSSASFCCSWLPAVTFCVWLEEYSRDDFSASW